VRSRPHRDLSERSKVARYSLDFAIKIAIGKYLDHLPLALGILQNESDPVAYRYEELASKTFSLRLVPVGGFL
jgi:hypothetical protein